MNRTICIKKFDEDDNWEWWDWYSTFFKLVYQNIIILCAKCVKRLWYTITNHSFIKPKISILTSLKPGWRVIQPSWNLRNSPVVMAHLICIERLCSQQWIINKLYYSLIIINSHQSINWKISKLNWQFRHLDPFPE